MTPNQTTVDDILDELFTEEQLIANYLQAEKARDLAEAALSKHFNLQVDELIDELKTNPQATKYEYMDLVQGIINNVPDSVTKIFLKDKFRQAFKGFKS